MAIEIINNVSTYSVSSYDVSNKWKLLSRLPIAYANDLSFILRGELVDNTNNNNTFSENLTKSFENSIMIRLLSVSLPAMSLETVEIPHISFNSKM
jgi:hypothetical protein